MSCVSCSNVNRQTRKRPVQKQNVTKQIRKKETETSERISLQSSNETAAARKRVGRPPLKSPTQIRRVSRVRFSRPTHKDESK